MVGIRAIALLVSAGLLMPLGSSQAVSCTGVGGSPQVAVAQPVTSGSILGNAVASASSMANWVRQVNPNPRIDTSIDELASLYLSEGARLGIRGDVAFAQAVKETGWFKFGGMVLPEDNNYAGIGATNNSGGRNVARFDSPQIGVRAHIQHLYAYASKNALSDPVVDPRFHLVTRGIAPNWADLDGRWAVPGVGYGESILALYQTIPGVNATLPTNTNEGNRVPVGAFEPVKVTGVGQISVSGWAFDPDDDGPISVHIYVGSKGFDIGKASVGRSDVQKVYGLGNANHGFSTTLKNVPVGTQQVCAYAINWPSGANPLLGCQTVDISGNRVPVGAFEPVKVTGVGQISVSGWAFDPDDDGPISVHIYVGSKGFDIGKASVGRSDVQKVYGLGNANHGFNTTLKNLPAGIQDVCAYAINIPTGSNQKLGCQMVEIYTN